MSTPTPTDASARRRVQIVPSRLGLSIIVPVAIFALSACTQESQNRIGRAVQNWTGTDGVLEVYAGDKLVKRFMKIDKLSTASATSDGATSRPYRFGYGVLDSNLNGTVDSDEEKVYFEFSDYSTSYIFFENPGNVSG